MDLKAAYLQIHISRELWKYQFVQFKENTYCQTRLASELNVSSKVIATMLKTYWKDLLSDLPRV